MFNKKTPIVAVSARLDLGQHVSHLFYLWNRGMFLVVLFVLFVSLVVADKETCYKNEKALGSKWKEYNSFGPERKNWHVKCRMALSAVGFKSDQLNQLEGLRKGVIEEYDDKANVKYCDKLFEYYVWNCKTQYKDLMKRKSDAGKKMSFKKMMAPMMKKKQISEVQYGELESLCLGKHYETMCEMLVDYWYTDKTKNSIYHTDMDEDESQDYFGYPQLPITKQELYKLSNHQLRQIVEDRGVQCNGCRTKKDYVLYCDQIMRMPIKNNKKLHDEYQKELQKKQEL